MVCDQAKKLNLEHIELGLNPYSIGIWSATLVFHMAQVHTLVLILILLEYGLRHRFVACYDTKEEAS